MIYDYPPLHPEIISVFELSWGKRTALSDIRPYDALSIRIQGDTDFVVGDKNYHAKKGDIAYVPAYVQYLHKANRDEHVYVIHFTSNNQSKEIEIFTPKNVDLFVDLFQNMHRKCTNKLPGYLFAVTASFYKILELMHLQAEDSQSTIMKSFRNTLEYIVAFTGVMLSSLIMYLTGRFGGYRLCRRILGDKDCERASELLNHKGAVFFPLMMMFPMFPDDALVMVAGTLRMSLKWFIPSIVFGRGIGVVTIVFGLGTVPYDKFTTPWHWIGFISACAVFLVAVFYAAYRFNKYLETRNKKED